MPHITNKSRALKDIDDCAQIIVGYIALSKSQKMWKNIKILLNILTIIGIDKKRHRRRTNKIRIMWPLAEKKITMPLKISKKNYTGGKKIAKM